ncbi:MAG: hypothetical protein ABI346_00345 [Candidatus Baltobacteraceae bacterium]
MHPLRTFGPVLGAGVALALLAACSGGSQLAPGSALPGGNGPLSQARAVPAARPGPGWLSAEAAAGTALLYVADQFNQRVAIYSQFGKNPAPIGQITDAIGGPDGLFVDKKGTLYVCNFGTATVTEYPKGQTTHSKTLTGAGSPKYVVVGVDGTVYVSNFNASANGQVLEYANGSTTPTTTIPFQTYPAGLALDKLNRLYVAYNAPTVNDIEVLRFLPGKTTGKNLGIHITGGSAGGATIDSSGNLLIDNQGLPGVEVFPPGATQPSQLITGFNLAYQIALNHRNNHLYISDPFAPSVNEVTYPGAKPINTITNSLSAAFGVATSPDGPY